MRIGINGMGRIGRLVTRAGFGGVKRPINDPRRNNRLAIVHVNEIGCTSKSCAHLMSFDSFQGAWPDSSIEAIDELAIKIDERIVSYSAYAKPKDIPWGDLGVDLVLECTGKFLSEEDLSGHLQRGAKKVIVAAPIKFKDALNVVMGVNETLYSPERDHILSAASCTTNCLAPIVGVIHENLVIRRGQITTVHNPTNTNLVVDGAHNDLRRARSALVSMHPTTTGSASAIGLIYPELDGKLNGHAIRVPVANSSLTDCVFEVEKETNSEQVNRCLRAAAQSSLAGILGFEGRPLVSADFSGDTRSSIIDGLSTIVTDKHMVKIYSWYDNEMGYSCRMVDLACFIA